MEARNPLERVPTVAGKQVRNLMGKNSTTKTRKPSRAPRRRNVTGRESFQNSDDYDYEYDDDYDWLFGSAFLVFLIFVLSPGVLLTLPPGRGGVFMSGNTSTVAAFVHAVLIVSLLSLI